MNTNNKQRFLRLKASFFFQKNTKMKDAGLHQGDLIKLFEFIKQSKNINVGNMNKLLSALNSKYQELPAAPSPKAVSFPYPEDLISYFFAEITKGDYDERQIKHPFMPQQWKDVAFPDAQMIQQNPLQSDENEENEMADEQMMVIPNSLEFSQDDVFASQTFAATEFVDPLNNDEKEDADLVQETDTIKPLEKEETVKLLQHFNTAKANIVTMHRMFGLEPKSTQQRPTSSILTQITY